MDNSKTDQYIMISTLADPLVADATCEMLEGVGISVMLEHVELRYEGYIMPGYRLLVPERFSNRARMLVEIAESTYMRSGVPKKRGLRLSGEFLSKHGLAA